MYLGDFASRSEVEDQFHCKIPIDEKILLAVYTQECYEGSAFVLVQNVVTGNLFEVNGSHCSCYGLEDQWEPEAVNVRALRNRMKDGHVGPYEIDIKADLEKVLAGL